MEPEMKATRGAALGHAGHQPKTPVRNEEQRRYIGVWRGER